MAKKENITVQKKSVITTKKENPIPRPTHDQPLLKTRTALSKSIKKPKE